MTQHSGGDCSLAISAQCETLLMSNLCCRALHWVGQDFVLSLSWSRLSLPSPLHFIFHGYFTSTPNCLKICCLEHPANTKRLYSLPVIITRLRFSPEANSHEISYLVLPLPLIFPFFMSLLFYDNECLPHYIIKL